MAKICSEVLTLMFRNTQSRGMKDSGEEGAGARISVRSADDERDQDEKRTKKGT